MTEEKKQRTSKDVFKEIQDLLSTIDGISTADAFHIGSLVREYGNYAGSEAMNPLLQTLIGEVDKEVEKRLGKKPW